MADEIQRKYSVKEIDALRELAAGRMRPFHFEQVRVVDGQIHGPGGLVPIPDRKTEVVQIEQTVRTWMLAGVTVDELHEDAQRERDEAKESIEKTAESRGETVRWLNSFQYERILPDGTKASAA